MPEPNQDTQRGLPKVAVIIPCYNQGPYIQRAIMSAVQQDYPLKAIFVSDEGSTDDSHTKVMNLFNRYETKNELTFGLIDKTTVVLSKNPKPSGPSAARNRLIAQAWEHSDLFSMLDADDYYLPNKISKSVMAMSEDFESIGLVYTDALIYHENKNLFIREYREPYSKQRLHEECIVSNTPLISKRALSSLNHWYDEGMRTAEDWDLWLRLSNKHVFIQIPEALHVYRVTGKNASDVVDMKVWEENWRKINQRYNGQQ